jgi:hypothetical protein
LSTSNARSQTKTLLLSRAQSVRPYIPSPYLFRETHTYARDDIDLDFPWCGRLINTRDLSIKGDYTREIGRTSPSLTTGCLHHSLMLQSRSIDIRNALTVDLGRNPGLQIRQKAFTYVSSPSPHRVLPLPRTSRAHSPSLTRACRNLSLLRASISFNDTNLNPPRIVYLNIYQNLLFCAMKTLHHIAAVEGECVGEKREGFLLGELTSTIRSLDQKQKLVRALK